MITREDLLNEGYDFLKGLLSRSDEWYKTYDKESYNWLREPRYDLLRKFFEEERRFADILQKRVQELLPLLDDVEKVKVELLGNGVSNIMQDINDRSPSTVFYDIERALEKLKKKTMLVDGTIVDY